MTDPHQHAVNCAKRFLTKRKVTALETLLLAVEDELRAAPRGQVIRTTLMFGQSYVQHRLHQYGIPAETRMRAVDGAKKLEIVKL